MLNFIKRFFEWDGIAPNEKGFVQAALTAAPYILSALGGIFGKKGKKRYIDPEEFQRKYGARAIADETQQIANFILNSPYGMSLLGNAASSGQQFERDVAARSAQAMGDATSGASIFAGAGAGQAQNNLERGVKQDVIRSAIPIAAQNVRGYGQLALANLGEQNEERINTPSMFEKIAATAGQYAGAPRIATTKAKAPGEEVADEFLKRIRGGYTL